MNVFELMKKWHDIALSEMESELDSKKLQQIMEKCGSMCAQYHGSIEAVKTFKKTTGSIDELLAKLNAKEDFWCGKWIREADMIYSISQEYGCPLVSAGLVELSPKFCECSRGWVKAVFDEVLGTPVIVELTQAIGRGDSVCKFVVTIKKAKEIGGRSTVNGSSPALDSSRKITIIAISSVITKIQEEEDASVMSLLRDII